MGEDLSSGARVALTLITLCAVVAIVFSILRIMKNAANQGANTLSNGLNQMLLSQFDDYDQQIVDGNKALMAAATFQDQQVAICFVNKVAPDGAFNYGCLLKGATKGTAENSSDGVVYTIGSTTKQTNPTKTPDEFTNASLKQNSTNGVKNSYYSAEIDIDGGAAKWNLNTRPTTRGNTNAYVRSTAKYYAMLIRNDTNDIVGIIFRQQD